MSGTRITIGTVEPLQIYAMDLAGFPLVGALDLYLRARRVSDGLYLDWNDLVFKSSGWTIRDHPLTEVDAVLAKGLYEVAGGIDTTGFTDTDLVLLPFQSPGDDVVLPAPAELKIGQWAGDIYRRLHLDRNAERVDTPTSIKVPADGSLIDIAISTSGNEVTGQRS